MWYRSFQIIGFILSLYSISIYSINALLYPATSVIQLVGSLSVPISDLLSYQRVLFDWGFQMNYDMPFNLSSFYNIPIWDIGENSTSRMMRRNYLLKNGGVHAKDFSVMEVYKATEELLEGYGFHASCLQLAICDLMQFPFENENQHIISEVIAFFLRPTKHFKHNKIQRKTLEPYTLAELRGKMGLDCSSAYTNCTKNPLDLFSKIDYAFMGV